MKPFDLQSRQRRQFFGDKHCDKYLVSVGRICDEPATINFDGYWRCEAHDPLNYSKRAAPSNTSTVEAGSANSEGSEPAVQVSKEEGE